MSANEFRPRGEADEPEVRQACQGEHVERVLPGESEGDGEGAGSGAGADAGAGDHPEDPRLDAVLAEVADGPEGRSVRAERPALGELFQAVARPTDPDPDDHALTEALGAFRAARDSGALAARPRRRDDWRPRSPRQRFAVRATVGALLAGLTVGGVAVAGIGAPADEEQEPKSLAEPKSSPPVATSPTAPSSEPTTPATSPRPSASKAPDATKDPLHPQRPSQAAPAQDLEALCWAFAKVEGRGAAIDATAWQRLVEAAGGEADVPAFCADEVGAPKGRGELRDQPPPTRR